MVSPVTGIAEKGTWESEEHGDVAGLVGRIGVLARVDDQFGDDKTEDHREVGGDHGLLGIEPDAAPDGPVAEARFETGDQFQQVFARVDLPVLGRQMELPVDACDRGDASD